MKDLPKGIIIIFVVVIYLLFIMTLFPSKNQNEQEIKGILTNFSYSHFLEIFDDVTYFYNTFVILNNNTFYFPCCRVNLTSEIGNIIKLETKTYFGENHIIGYWRITR